MTSGTVSPESRVVTRPPFRTWSALIGSCREGDGGSTPERHELLAAARRYSESIGVEAGPVHSDVPVILCGHQAEMQHPGITVKTLAASRVAAYVGGVAVNIVVDTDEVGAFAARVPVWASGPSVCDVALIDPPSSRMSGWEPTPDRATLDHWLDRQSKSVSTARLSMSPLQRFADIARDGLGGGGSLASWATAVRRRFEASLDSGTTVLELPVSQIISTKAWEDFVSVTLADAVRFSTAYNRALAEFRVRHKTRSAAQPFPDLEVDDAGRWEAPFWSIDGEGFRRSVTVDELRGVPARLIAPKAVTLTLFLRSHLADLAIQGLGGERYDEVTDDLANLLGIPLAPRVSATADVLLPWKTDVPATRERSAVLEDRDRVRHHPEEWLDHSELSPNAFDASRALLAEKRALVARIAAPGADKKSIGIRIKSINTELASALEPVIASLDRELAEIEVAEATRQVIETRSFSFPLFDPAELSTYLESALTDSV